MMNNVKYTNSSIQLAIGTAIYMSNGVRFLLPAHPQSTITAVASVAIALSTYSLAPKPKTINALNWLIVPLIGFLFILIASIFEPKVMDGFRWAIVFTIFTYFVPAAIYLALIISNFIACNTFYNIENKVEPISLSIIDKELHNAVINNDIKSVQRCLENGANPTLNNELGYSAIDYARGRGLVDIQSILEKNQ